MLSTGIFFIYLTLLLINCFKTVIFFVMGDHQLGHDRHREDGEPVMAGSNEDGELEWFVEPENPRRDQSVELAIDRNQRHTKIPSSGIVLDKTSCSSRKYSGWL